MNELKQEAIKNHYANLVECMDPWRVVDHLAKLLSLEEMELIRKAQLTSEERNRELIAILFKKNEDLGPFERFIKALEETDKRHETMAKAILKIYKHDNGAAESEKVPSTSLSDAGETKYRWQVYTFNSHNHGGRNVSGRVSGKNVTIVQGDYYASGQAPSTSSSTPSQPSAEDWQQTLVNAQQSLKKMYLTRFQKVHPFSLPFTFDIENTWVSLALKDHSKSSEATEEHAKLLETAFEKAKMLIIEGNPATGKTSLMRRLAYEWATEKKELSCFDFVIYAEFREVREQTFETVADLVIQFNKKYENFVESGDFEYLKPLLSNKRCCEKQRILLLLDGYDESSLDKQCRELSTYIDSSAIQNPLMFYVVLTTRPGYLSKYRGNEGRFIFAEVLGFTTKEQKEQYITKHFLSKTDIDKKNIAAVHHLLDNNVNLNKLAETPLFLTFICVVHERIVDGTLLELYCNIVWWLIDRHQKNYPDQNIPVLFGFHSDCSDKFETIQDHYLHFPQLHCLGSMALHNIEKNVFKLSDYAQFNLHPIIEQVGLLRKEKNHDNSFKLVTSFFFPHRTIQEFIAAFYCFCSNDDASEWLIPNTTLDPLKINAFERFLLRIALSESMPIKTEKRKYYFERIADIELDITSEAFNTNSGFKHELINWFFTQCINVHNIRLTGTTKIEIYVFKMLNETSKNNGTEVTFQLSSPTVLSFSNLIMLHSVTFGNRIKSGTGCTFEANSQLSFTNCPSLKYLKFKECKMRSSTIIGIATLPAIDTVEFFECTFEANFQLSFTNCPSLRYLKFNQCEIKGSTIFDIATLPAIDTLEFYKCKIDLASWQSITDQIKNSSIKCWKLTFGELLVLKNFGRDFNKEFLIHLQKCFSVEEMEIAIWGNEVLQNDLFLFSDLIKLHSLLLYGWLFEANSQLSFTNCPVLKKLQFSKCEIKSSINLGIATFSAIDTLIFYECTIGIAAWQSITDQIKNSSVKILQLTLAYSFTKEFLIHLKKCNNVEKVEITIESYTIRHNDMLSFSDLIKLYSLAFSVCTFEANSQLSFKDCPSLKNLKFHNCEINSSTIIGIATLPAIDTVEIYKCKIDLASWQSITDQIKNNSVKYLKLSADYFIKGIYPEFQQYLQKCERIQQIHVKDVFDSKWRLTLSLYDEEVTVNLAKTARELPALTSITFSDQYDKRLDESRRLKEKNKERIEKAGQERNPDFSVKYVDTDPELEE